MLPSVRMQAAKDTVREILDRLPEDCSLDDVIYQLHVVQSVQRGLADVEAGKMIPHDAAMKELRDRWLVGRAK